MSRYPRYRLNTHKYTMKLYATVLHLMLLLLNQRTMFLHCLFFQTIIYDLEKFSNRHMNKQCLEFLEHLKESPQNVLKEILNCVRLIF
jgi:hypothetical protein